MLDQTSDLICRHFRVKDFKHLEEHFFANWEPDHASSWRRDRGIAGHNLAIPANGFVVR